MTDRAEFKFPRTLNVDINPWGYVHRHMADTFRDHLRSLPCETLSVPCQPDAELAGEIEDQLTGFKVHDIYAEVSHRDIRYMRTMVACNIAHIDVLNELAGTQ